MILAACNAHGGPALPTDSPYSSDYAQILDLARMKGASDEQIAQIDEYIDGREIPYSVVQEAFTRTDACLEAAGLESAINVSEVYPGYYSSDFMFRSKDGVTDEGDQDVGTACQDREVTYIGLLYDNQPGWIAARDAAFEARRPELLACLRDHGVAIEDDATYDEMMNSAVELLRSGVVAEPVCIPPQ